MIFEKNVVGLSPNLVFIRFFDIANEIIIFYSDYNFSKRYRNNKLCTTIEVYRSRGDCCGEYYQTGPRSVGLVRRTFLIYIFKRTRRRDRDRTTTGPSTILIVSSSSSSVFVLHVRWPNACLMHALIFTYKPQALESSGVGGGYGEGVGVSSTYDIFRNCW